MATIKILEYTFNNTIDSNCMPSLTGVSNTEIIDSVNDFVTTRIINVEESELPVGINFLGKTALLTINYINVGQIRSAFNMFNDCSNLTDADLSSLDTSKVTNMQQMFRGCTNLVNLNISNLDTSSVTTMREMFAFCYKLTKLNLEHFATKNVIDMSLMFKSCKSLTDLSIDGWDTYRLTDVASMFEGCSSLTKVNLSYINTRNVKSFYNMFTNCSSLTSLDLSSFKTSSATTMYGMFTNCSSLTSLDLSNFDTSKVTDIQHLFSGCSSLKSVSLKGLDMSNVLYMNYVFRGCSSLKVLDLSGFDTASVKSLQGMFEGCSSLTYLDLSSFNTSDVNNMAYMFQSCINLEEVDLSSFTAESLTTAYSMFNRCMSLKALDLSSFKTDKLVNMAYMLQSCNELSMLDLSNFNMDAVTNNAGVFFESNKIKHVGLLYASSQTINKIASLFTSAHLPISLYYLDAKNAELTPINQVSFIQYRSTSAKPSDPITLRSIPYKALDEIDINTKRHTQRVGVITLDGSEKWSIIAGGSANNPELTRFQTGVLSGVPAWNADSVVCCNVMASLASNQPYHENVYLSNSNVGVVLFKQDIKTVAELKSWLASHPMTLHYELKTPIEKVIELELLNQSGLKIAKMNSFANAGITIQTNSDSSKPFFEYEFETNNSYHLDILKTSTKYTLKNLKGKFTINGNEYQAAENLVLTFPSFAQEPLMIVDNVQTAPMMLEGDLSSKSTVYFKGIASSFDEDQAKIVITNSNLIINNERLKNEGIHYYTKGWSAIRFTTKATKVKIIITNKTGVTGTKFNVKDDVESEANFLQLFGVGQSFDRVEKEYSLINSNVISLCSYGSQSFSSGYFFDNYEVEIYALDGIDETSIPEKTDVTTIETKGALRSLPNGVRDEIIIDRAKGKATLIRRIGFDVLNTSNPNITYFKRSPHQDSAALCGFDINFKAKHHLSGTGIFRCDRIAASSTGNKNTPSISSYYDTVFVIRIPKHCDGTPKTLSEFQDWLDRVNPAVCFQLAYPEIVEIDLKSIPYIYGGSYIFFDSFTKPFVGLEYTVNQGQRIVSHTETLQRHDKQLSQLDRLLADLVYSDYYFAVQRFHELLTRGGKE